MKLGSSLPPSAETRPLSWMNSMISSGVFNRRLGLSRCSRTRIASAFLISLLGFELRTLIHAFERGVSLDSRQ
jgi:hypothetical protein